MFYYYDKEEEEYLKQGGDHSNIQQQFDLSHFNQTLPPPSDFLLNDQHDGSASTAYYYDPNDILNSSSLIDWHDNAAADWQALHQQLQPEQILLSDPDFVRQHQVLQDHQDKLNRSQVSGVNEDAETEQKKPKEEKKENRLQQQQQQQQQHKVQGPSSLTILSEPVSLSTTPLQPHRKESPQQVLQQPSMTDKIADNNITESQAAKKQQQKRTNNRRPQAVGKSSTANNANTNSKPNKPGNSNATAERSGEASKIDHQRRFNELQARFRVNYARKPATQNTPLEKSSASNTQHSKSTTLTGSKHPPLSEENRNDKAPGAEVAHMIMNGVVMDTSHSFIKPATDDPAKTATATLTNKRPISKEYSFSTSSKLSFPSRTMPIQIERVSRPHHLPLSSSASSSFALNNAEAHQKLLDKQLEKVDFDDITVAELKELLRQRGKPATGKKAVLLQRLQEEKELVKTGLSGPPRSPGVTVSSRVANRHSKPLPYARTFNNNNNADPTTGIQQHQQQQRPLSFPGVTIASTSSPVSVQQNNSNSSTMQLTPNGSSFIPPPISPGGQLYRSIANMHIGSPPANSTSSARRYSPYSTRLSSSPKSTMHHCNHEHAYSTSVPSFPSSPNNTSTNYWNTNTNSDSNQTVPLSTSYSIAAGASSSSSAAATTTTRPTNRYYNGHQKSYKPFTSSALATPDRDEDVNPFDTYYMNRTPASESQQPRVNEDDKATISHSAASPPIYFSDPIYSTNSTDASGGDFNHQHGFDLIDEQHYRPSFDTQLGPFQYDNSNNQNDDMDWSEPAILDLLLQQGTINMNMAEMIGQPLYSDDVVLTNEQIMALLHSQQHSQPFEFKLQNTNFRPNQPLYQLQQQYLQQQQQQE